MGMMCRLVLSFLSVMALLSGYSQSKTLSYLQLKDSVNHYVYVQPIKSLEFGEKLLAKAIQEDNSEQIGNGYEALAVSYYLLKQFEKAQQEAKNYLRHAKSIEDQGMVIEALLQNADVELMLGEVDLAHQLLLEASKIADNTNDDIIRETVMSKLAGFYGFSGNAEKAIEMQLKTLEIFKKRPIDSTFSKAKKFQTMAYSYAIIAGLYLKKEQVDSANFYNEKLREVAIKEDSCQLIYYYNVKGEIALYQKEFLKAETFFQKSYDYCPPQHPLFELNMAFRFGKAAFGLGDFAETKTILLAGLSQYEVSDAEEAFMDEYYKLLAESCKELGDFEQANLYFEKYINTQSKLGELKDNLTASMKAKEIADFKEALEKQKRKLEKNSNKYYYFGLAGTLAIILLLMLLLRFYQIRKRNEARFEALLNQVEKVQEKEKGSEAVLMTEESGISNEVFSHIISGFKALEENKYFLNQD